MLVSNETVLCCLMQVKIRVQDILKCGSPPIDEYICEDANFKRVGDVGLYYEIIGTCPNGIGKDKACTAKIHNLKITRGPREPTQAPKNKWVDTNYLFVPSSVKAVVRKQASKLTPIRRAAPLDGLPRLYKNNVT
jgi:hypothetical protein